MKLVIKTDKKSLCDFCADKNACLNPKREQPGYMIVHCGGLKFDPNSIADPDSEAIWLFKDKDPHLLQ
jgi:hypothetical protein